MRSWKSHTWLGLNPQIGRPLSSIVGVIGLFLFFFSLFEKVSVSSFYISETAPKNWLKISIDLKIIKIRFLKKISSPEQGMQCSVKCIYAPQQKQKNTHYTVQCKKNQM
jgi:hypothetical protein